MQIAARTIGATISTDATPVVTFHEDNVDYNAPEMLQEIANVTAMASWLEQELVRANKRMGISRGYLNKVRMTHVTFPDSTCEGVSRGELICAVASRGA
jgi:2-methylaconitate cis-trans-isomerase PrpF